MSPSTQVPRDLRYTKNDEWVRWTPPVAVVGITDFAQSELTDVVFVELPAEGGTVKAGERLLVLESVKTVADVYAPVSGRISKVNQELKGHPELLNKDPYGQGWLVEIQAENPPSDLLSPEEYLRKISSPSEGHH